MEENEKTVVEGASKKSMKNVIIGIIAAIVVILLVIGIVNIVKPTPEKTVKQFLKNIENKKASKVVDAMDFVGLQAWAQCAGDYEDFKDNYEDAKEDADDDKDEYEEAIDEYKEEMEEAFDEFDKLKIEVKSIKKARKVKDAKNLYKVTAKVKVEYRLEDDDDTERDTSTYEFYLYKKGGKYYIVGLDTKSGKGYLESGLF